MGLLGRKKHTITPADMLVMEIGSLMERTPERAAAGVGRHDSTPGYRIISEGRRVVVYLSESTSEPDFTERQLAFVERIRPVLVGHFGKKRVGQIRYGGTYYAFEVELK